MCYIVSRGLRENYRGSNAAPGHGTTTVVHLPIRMSVADRLFFFYLIFMKYYRRSPCEWKTIQCLDTAATRLFRTHTIRVLACRDIIIIILFSIPEAASRDVRASK